MQAWLPWRKYSSFNDIVKFDIDHVVNEIYDYMRLVFAMQIGTCGSRNGVY